MLMAEAARRKDKNCSTSVWFKRHVEVATDHVYGGVFRNLRT
jgi:hypothetical protein